MAAFLCSVSELGALSLWERVGRGPEFSDNNYCFVVLFSGPLPQPLSLWERSYNLTNL